MNLRKPVKRKRHDTNRRIKKKKNRKLFHKQQQINNNNNLIRATPVPTREGIKQSSSRMRIRILRSLVNIPANDNINGTHQNTQKIQQEAADEPEEVIFPKRSLRDRRQQVDYRGCE
jgi:hypothetical protein